MNQIKTKQITRVRTISKEVFNTNFYKPQRPVLIEDLTKDWNAFKRTNQTLSKIK